MTRPLSGVLAALCALAGAASAQTRAGGEFRVNTYTTGTQSYSSVGRDARGNFVVAWSDAQGGGVQAQRYDRAGLRVGAEFVVNSSTGYVQFPSVAMNARGDFLVAWGQNSGAGSADIRARAFAASGAPVGAELRLNEFTTGSRAAPTVAADGRGNFVAVWWSQGGLGFDIAGRRVSRQGVPLGAEFVANTYTTGRQYFSDVAAGPNGDFVVAWSSYPGTDGDASSLNAQRFDAAGTPLGDNFQVNTYTTGLQIAAGVAVAPDGGFVIAYLSTQTTGGDVYAQRFAADGARLGAEFLVNSSTNGIQAYQHLSMDSAGNFVVAWTDFSGDGTSPGIRARRFRADGTPRGGDFAVNTYTTGVQLANKVAASVASDPAGNVVVTWYSDPQDLGGIDAYAQRYGGLHPQSLSVDAAGNLVWEPGETVAVRPAWFNASGAAQTVNGGLASLAGPAGPTYTITDATAVYGTIADNVAQACTDCYAVSVSAPATRPATHWDAAAIETLTPDTQGQAKKWTLHVGASFTDVPTTNGFYRFIETVLHHGITSGCTPTQYCPGDPTARDQMAVFVLLGKEGPGYAPQACGTPLFSDVPAASPFCRYVEELARRGVVAGCGGGRYCPADPVTREQLSVFLLRTLDPALNPPACTTPVFGDVPASSPFCRWIEEMARRGITGGCGGGNFCPQAPVTREQMAVFISVTFGLTLYGA